MPFWYPDGTTLGGSWRSPSARSTASWPGRRGRSCATRGAGREPRAAGRGEGAAARVLDGVRRARPARPASARGARRRRCGPPGAGRGRRGARPRRRARPHAADDDRVGGDRGVRERRPAGAPAAGPRLGGDPAALGIGGSLTLADGTATGDAGVVLGGGLAELLVLPVSDDMIVVRADAPGVTVEVPENLDPSRRSARVTLASAAADVLPGAKAARSPSPARSSPPRRSAARSNAWRTPSSTPRCGSSSAVPSRRSRRSSTTARTCSSPPSWPRPPCGTPRGPRPGRASQFELAAAVAAALALPGFTSNTGLNIQVHGGIGFTWEHDAHLLMRRAATLEAVFEPHSAERDVTRLKAAASSARRPSTCRPRPRRSARGSASWPRRSPRCPPPSSGRSSSTPATSSRTGRARGASRRAPGCS